MGSLQDCEILVDIEGQAINSLERRVYGFFHIFLPVKSEGDEISCCLNFEHLVNFIKMNGYSFIFAHNSTIFDLSTVIYFSQLRKGSDLDSI